VLAGGLDRLDLSLYVRWTSGAWFEELTKAKQEAQANNEATPITIETPDGPAAFAVQTTGAEGHEWIIKNQHYTLSIGNWIEPKQRPSVSLLVRAETIWHAGIRDAVARIVRMLESLGGKLEPIKVSRLDPCVDILMRESDWRRDIEAGLVTRARDINPYTQHRELTGFAIGKNDISARFYDKPVEIARQSRKFWMFDIWGTDTPPGEHRIIRIEFQLRREKIKLLGVDTLNQLDDRLPGIWAYCTQNWLRVVQDASVHHTQQKLRPWWPVVQNGFPGAQGAEPLVLSRAVNADRELVARQALGCLASLFAHEIKVPLGPDDRLPMAHILRDVLREAGRIVGWDEDEFSRRVRLKQAKLWRYDSDLDGALTDAQISCADSSMEG
jgi:hypothetical protein